MASVSRWLHIYLSMFSFAVLLFFAVTGLTLNHATWFDGQERTTQFKGSVPPAWMGKDVDKLQIVEYFRRTHHITGGLHDFRVDDSQLSVSFKGPGYAADASIDRTTGAYELSETRLGLWAVLNDLHKGRDTGKAWAMIIDISAVLMTLVSLTGFVLIFFLLKKRFSGLLLCAIGTVVICLAWWKLVP
ncbi:MAG TPA: PepSY-associated TM helix domain-containing protein [Candidatus Sulfopaludibacter sp.]|nr:PepSY-associated TM helix domain-containing protein [Candidatus Sulfopaludibacter sp.]